MVGAGLFLLLSACLDRQSLVRVPLYALQAWLCCSALAGVASAGFGGRRALRPSGPGALFSLPAAGRSFLLFPRPTGRLAGPPPRCLRINGVYYSNWRRAYAA